MKKATYIVATSRGLETLTGYTFTLDGFTFGVSNKTPDGETLGAWYITELTTGKSIGHYSGVTRAAAVDGLAEYLETVPSFSERVAETVRESGSLNYIEVSTATPVICAALAAYYERKNGTDAAETETETETETAPEPSPLVTSSDLARILEESGRVAYRAECIRREGLRAQVLAAYSESRDGMSGDPRRAVALLLERVGYSDAAAAIATEVNEVGTWDARISDDVRRWAENVPGALDKDAAERLGFFSGRIHPAHLDGLARTMSTTPEPEPTPEPSEETAPEIPDAVKNAPDFEYWVNLRPPFSASVVREFIARFGVYVSTSNGKTAIPSANLLAGSVGHEYDGSASAAGVEERGGVKICGTCSGDCPGCYAKAMTRYTATYEHDFDNTVAVRVNPGLYVASVEALAFSSPLGLAAFRWHDSGDFCPSKDPEINRRYYRAVMECAARHPFTHFGGYTKEAEVVLWYGLDNIPENFCLSCSPWEGHCDPIGDLPQFIYDDGSNPELDTVAHCPAVDRFGRRTGVTCAECGHCYTAKRGARRAVYAHDAAGRRTLRANLLARGRISAEDLARVTAEERAERAAKKAENAAKKTARR